jgi:hypothetical protein
LVHTTARFELNCPTCGEKLIFDDEPSQFLGCLHCNLVSEFIEDQQTGEATFSEFRLIKKREFLMLFAKNPIIIAKNDEQKEKRLLGFVWLLMFVILLIVSWILYYSKLPLPKFLLFSQE